MAYARFSSDSDVYVYKSVRGGYECCGCLLPSDEISIHFDKIPLLLDHLVQHRIAGHKVPQRVIDQLTREFDGGN